jgi:hypothetical protein
MSQRVRDKQEPWRVQGDIRRGEQVRGGGQAWRWWYLSAEAHTQPSRSVKWSASQWTRLSGSSTGRKCRLDSSEERKVSKSSEGGGEASSARELCCCASGEEERERESGGWGRASI